MAILCKRDGGIGGYVTLRDPVGAATLDYKVQHGISFVALAVGILYAVTIGRVLSERRSMRRRGIPVTGPPTWALLVAGLAIVVVFAVAYFA